MDKRNKKNRGKMLKMCKLKHSGARAHRHKKLHEVRRGLLHKKESTEEGLCRYASQRGSLT